MEKINILCHKITSFEFLRDTISILGNVYSPSLKERFGKNFTQYVEKLFFNGVSYVACVEKQIVGVISFYNNDLINRSAFISQIIVHPTLQNMGVGKKLISICEDCARNNNMKAINLEVKKSNENGVRFYKKCDFSITKETEQSFIMTKSLEEKDD